MAEELTDLQRCFVEEYIANGFKDAKHAALRAGYSESVADSATIKVVGSESVRTAIEEAKKVVRELRRDRLLGIADSAIDTLADILSDLHVGTASARVSAAKTILDMAGIGEPSRIEHTGRDGGPIEHNVLDALRERLSNRRRKEGTTDDGGERS